MRRLSAGFIGVWLASAGAASAGADVPPDAVAECVSERPIKVESWSRNGSFTYADVRVRGKRYVVAASDEGDCFEAERRWPYSRTTARLAGSLRSVTVSAFGSDMDDDAGVFVRDRKGEVRGGAIIPDCLRPELDKFRVFNKEWHTLKVRCSRNGESEHLPRQRVLLFQWRRDHLEQLFEADVGVGGFFDEELRPGDYRTCTVDANGWIKVRKVGRDAVLEVLSATDDDQVGLAYTYRYQPQLSRFVRNSKPRKVVVHPRKRRCE